MTEAAAETVNTSASVASQKVADGIVASVKAHRTAAGQAQQAEAQAQQLANVAAQARMEAEKRWAAAMALAEALGITDLDEAVKTNAFGLGDALRPKPAPTTDTPDEFGA